ncbi:hypothetical protein I553_3387 [Mycobacterium xenopi 4042]|uniref:Uncharacterized protein n=1 Tax=Mycobacterium xenopi 4042 TaxID=1299334 RepID=X8BDE4_MYCXE|nr:hypothetical protein I553_3387 [Mycobacterium xenopi 4042]
MEPQRLIDAMEQLPTYWTKSSRLAPREDEIEGAAKRRVEHRASGWNVTEQDKGVS